jgi:hypothetical protein
MIIHTYHEPLPGVDRGEILELWAESWRRHGWIPVIHCRGHAREHSRALVYEAVAAALPTVNPSEYELACWRRWLVAAQCGGFWCDDDLVNCGFKPRHALAHNDGEHPFVAFHAGDTPNTGLMFGGRSAFEEFFVNRVCAGLVPIGREQDRPHTSDMFLWQQLHRDGLFQDVRDMADGYGKPGDLKLVHCSHGHTADAGTTQVEAMRKLVVANTQGEAQPPAKKL